MTLTIVDMNESKEVIYLFSGNLVLGKSAEMNREEFPEVQPCEARSD